jgi:uncharacterized damage-inducible protein DinB
MSTDRATIVSTLETQRAELERRIRSLDAELLSTPCTSSEDPDGDDWSAKDHLAHLLRIERAFLGMSRLTIAGDPAPIKIGGSTREERLAQIHSDNENQVAERKDADVERLLAELSETRKETLAFIAELSDEQLATPIPGAPWGDGTIGGVLMANAGHERQHLAWVDEGLAAL